MGHAADLESGSQLRHDGAHGEHGGLSPRAALADRRALAPAHGPKDDALTESTTPAHIKLASVILYGCVSGSLTFFNKAVVSTHKFNFPLTILVVQMATAVAVLRSVRALGLVSFPDFQMARAKAIAPMTSMYLINVMFALSSLARVNVPMYSVLKRLTPFIVLITAAVTTGKMASCKVMTAVCLMVAGAVVAGMGDAEFSSRGYLLALGSSFSQAAYLMYVQRTGKGKAKAGLSAHGLLYLQALISLPVLIVLSILFEYSAVSQHTLSSSLLVTLGTSSLLGALLNFALFWCTMSNSALTTTIVGVVKGSATTLIGVLFLSKLPTLLNMFGILLNTVGAVLYSLIKAKVIRA